MTSDNAVVTEAEVLLKIPLLHEIDVDSNCSTARERTIEPFGTYAAEHLFKVSAVQAVVLVVGQAARMCRLQVGHRKTRGRLIFAHECSYTRQVARRRITISIVVIEKA